ncbi:hypothetical protein BGW39_002163 [Mortierella sp. 14UC]|nr:hypothetical protein BGW39_002163 [Mortierella sp. 14UC]
MTSSPRSPSNASSTQQLLRFPKVTPEAVKRNSIHVHVNVVRMSFEAEELQLYCARLQEFRTILSSDVGIIGAFD